jgi:hypothetical protein
MPQPDPNAPQAPAQPEPRKVLPLEKDALAKWRSDIDAARAVRKQIEGWAEANLEAYAPALSDDPEQYGAEINTNRDFTLVERKKADLFYQKPDLIADPSALMAGQEPLVETQAVILNEKLGLDGVNAKVLVHRVLFDILCPTGTGWTIMGYESATVPVQQTVPDGEQMMPGAVLGLQPVPKMKQVTVPVPIWENCFWRHFSPRQALVPANARTTECDVWPWVGMEFEIPIRTAKRKQWVPEDFTGSSANPDLYFDYGLNIQPGDEVARCVLIVYKSSLYRDDQPHPLHQTELILVEGLDEPAEHRDSPYQTLTPQGGLTPDSLLRFPIYPCTIRVLTDAAHVPSDCTISRPLVNELNVFRQQMLDQRDANVLRWIYNVDTLPTDALTKIVRSPIGGFIGVPQEAFVADGAIKQLEHGTFPRENFQFNDYLDNDLARTHAIDAEQSGAGQTGDQSATESQIKQNNVNARLGLERGVFLDWYITGATMFSCILQRFLPVADAAAIVGQEKAQAWDQWRHTVPASLAFTLVPDSSLRTDMAVDRKRKLDQYTFFANDPFIDRVAHLKHILPTLGLPSTLVKDQPPEKGPEPMKFTLALASADLNPMLPQYANLYQILTQQGVKDLIAPMPEAQLNQPPLPGDEAHGGKVAQMEGLSKHAVDQTGGMQGSGSPAPMGPGGAQG